LHVVGWRGGDEALPAAEVEQRVQPVAADRFFERGEKDAAEAVGEEVAAGGTTVLTGAKYRCLAPGRKERFWL